MHKPCAVIPVYNHEAAVPAVVDACCTAACRACWWTTPAAPACAAVLAQLAERDMCTW
jgi:hypothetical protein